MSTWHIQRDLDGSPYAIADSEDRTILAGTDCGAISTSEEVLAKITAIPELFAFVAEYAATGQCFCRDFQTLRTGETCRHCRAVEIIRHATEKVVT